MATKYGTNAAKYLNSVPVQLVEQSEFNGRVHVMYDEYVLSATNLLTNADTIKMGAPIPNGARIVNAFVDTDDLDSAAAGAFTVGWAASADGVEAANTSGFFTTVDCHTAALARMLNTATVGAAAAASEGKFKKFTAACQPTITVTGTGDQTSGKIRLCIEYLFD